MIDVETSKSLDNVVSSLKELNQAHESLREPMVEHRRLAGMPDHGDKVQESINHLLDLAKEFSRPNTSSSLTSILDAVHCLNQYSAAFLNESIKGITEGQSAQELFMDALLHLNKVPQIHERFSHDCPELWAEASLDLSNQTI